MEAEHSVIYKPDRLRRTLSEKYRRLFRSAALYSPFRVEKIHFVTQRELEECLGMISFGKEDGNELYLKPNPSTSVVRSKITQFLNGVFKDRRIPAYFNCVKPHLLNKLKLESLGLDDLRPIMITFSLVKLIV